MVLQEQRPWQGYKSRSPTIPNSPYWQHHSNRLLEAAWKILYKSNSKETSRVYSPSGAFTCISAWNVCSWHILLGGVLCNLIFQLGMCTQLSSFWRDSRFSELGPPSLSSLSQTNLTYFTIHLLTQVHFCEDGWQIWKPRQRLGLTCLSCTEQISYFSPSSVTLWEI